MLPNACLVTLFVFTAEMKREQLSALAREDVTVTRVVYFVVEHVKVFIVWVNFENDFRVIQSGQKDALLCGANDRFGSFGSIPTI